MTVSFSIDEFGRIVCDLQDSAETAVVTSSDAAGAARALLEALAAAERDGYGECVWAEGAGEYWWILRRDGTDVTCAVMWSRGTLTGWQHLLRVDTPFDAFIDDVRRGVARLPLEMRA